MQRKSFNRFLILLLYWNAPAFAGPFQWIGDFYDFKQLRWGVLGNYSAESHFLQSPIDLQETEPLFFEVGLILEKRLSDSFGLQNRIRLGVLNIKPEADSSYGTLRTLDGGYTFGISYVPIEIKFFQAVRLEASLYAGTGPLYSFLTYSPPTDAFIGYSGFGWMAEGGATVDMSLGESLTIRLGAGVQARGMSYTSPIRSSELFNHASLQGTFQLLWAPPWANGGRKAGR